MNLVSQQKALAQSLHSLHESITGMPDKARAQQFLDATLEAVFPQMLGHTGPCNAHDVECCIERAMGHFVAALLPTQRYSDAEAEQLARAFFFEHLPHVARMAWQDARATLAGDPAAQSLGEVVATYPGVQATVVYRMAHVLYTLGVPILPRMMTEIAHLRTGIDIHPGAQIGESFCIDHGTGIVIGETSVIGKRVKLYQGVTLGALSVKKELASAKRHASVGDDVVIYANATILGGDTVIGDGSVIGGNVWLTESVPAYTRVLYDGKTRQRSLLPDYSI